MIGMAKVFGEGSFSVYVYCELHGPHKLPHCHVRTKESDTVVSLPLLTVLVGPKLPRDIRRALQERLEEIWRAWERLNPGAEGGTQ
jgi:hypothetical protein